MPITSLTALRATAIVLPLSVMPSVHAAEPASVPRLPALLAALDADQDGRLTLAELEADRERQFARFDQDRDGRLTAAEYEALWLDAARERLARQFRADDRDHDGNITLAELKQRSMDLVRRRDVDKDGALTAEELRRHRPAGKAG